MAWLATLHLQTILHHWKATTAGQRATVAESLVEVSGVSGSFQGLIFPAFNDSTQRPWPTMRNFTVSPKKMKVKASKTWEVCTFASCPCSVSNQHVFVSHVFFNILEWLKVCRSANYISISHISRTKYPPPITSRLRWSFYSHKLHYLIIEIEGSCHFFDAWFALKKKPFLTGILGSFPGTVLHCPGMCHFGFSLGWRNPGSPSRPNFAIGRIGNPESMDHPKDHSLFGLGLPSGHIMLIREISPSPLVLR